jgi:ABC-type transport system involved in multi-copper enzyme maturation permease subunit
MSELENIARGWLRRNLTWSNTRQAWEERIGLTLILAVGAALVWSYGRMQLSLYVLAWGVLIATATLLLRRGWLRLFGPILFYDLVCIARRPRYFWMRTLYSCLLAGMLGWLYLLWMAQTQSRSMRPQELSYFAESFFYTFMSIQLIVVAILTPAYTAGAVSEEKERKTLEFLLATDLRNREIVLSKLVSRLANLTLLVVAGLPILSFLQFLGGVDPNLVLAGFAATGLTMVSLASLSIMNSVVAKKPRDAIALTYLAAVAYVCLASLSWILLDPSVGIANFPSTDSWTSPVTVENLVHWVNAGNVFSALADIFRTFTTGGNIAATLPTLLWNYALFHSVIALVCSVWSVWRVRAIALRQAHGETKKTSRRLRLFGRPRLRANPMLWKEVFAEPGIRFNLFGRLILVLLVGASFVPAGIILYLRLYTHPTSLTELSDGMNNWVRIVGTMVACLLLLAVATRSASSLSGERDRQTLDALLASPLTSDSILFAKGFGNIVSIRWGWAWLGLIYFLGLVTGGLHPYAFVLLVVSWFVYAAAISGIGVWFSLVCKTTLRATIWSLLATSAAGVGHWLIWMCCMPLLFFAGNQGSAFYDFQAWVAKFQAGLTPPVAMGFFFSFSAEDLHGQRMFRPDPEMLVGYGLAGLVCWSIGATVLWVVTRERFREVSGRTALRRPDFPERMGRVIPKLPASSVESLPSVEPVE